MRVEAGEAELLEARGCQDNYVARHPVCRKSSQGAWITYIVHGHKPQVDVKTIVDVKQFWLSRNEWSIFASPDNVSTLPCTHVGMSKQWPK